MDFDSPRRKVAIAAPLGPAADLLTHSLDQFGHIELHRIAGNELVQGWREDQFACALIPPLEYLQRDDGRLIPGLGVFVPDDAHTEILFYRDSVESVHRIAVGESAQPLAGLACLLVEEIAGTRPEFVAVSEDSIDTCDGYLASGLDSMLAEVRFDHRVGVQELWGAHSAAPLPLLVWAAAPRAPYPELRRRLARACQLGQGETEAIGAHYDRDRHLPAGTTHRYLGHRLRYSLGSLEAEALRDLHRLASRHNAVHPDAAVRFC